jgi:hypothetical protein
MSNSLSCRGRIRLNSTKGTSISSFSSWSSSNSCPSEPCSALVPDHPRTTFGAASLYITTNRAKPAIARWSYHRGQYVKTQVHVSSLAVTDPHSTKTRSRCGQLLGTSPSRLQVALWIRYDVNTTSSALLQRHIIAFKVQSLFCQSSINLWKEAQLGG